MSNANLGDSTPPVNNKAPAGSANSEIGIEGLLATISEVGGKVTSIDGGIAQLVQLLKLLIEKLTDHEAAIRRQAAEAAKPPIVVVPPKPAPVARKQSSRQATKIARETLAIIALHDVGPDLHKIAEVVAAHHGQCNFGSLYRYERFMRFYEEARERMKLERSGKIVPNAGVVPKGFQTLGGGVEAVDSGDIGDEFGEDFEE